MQINFAKDCWEEKEFTTCYSFRFTETPRFTQEADHVRTAVNPDHREGYDNISMLTKDTYTTGATATLHCAFEGLGCPEIILVEKMEECEDGATRYGACFEIVLWKNGINVWRHYREAGKCFWHLRMGLEYPVAENAVHELQVKVEKDALVIWLNGQKTTLHTEDVFQNFHMGLTGCEGIAKIYDWTVEA